MEKSADAFRTISEVADDLALPQHVLRFWETRFPQVRPLKRAGGRRYYRPNDILLLRTIRQLLYDDGYTIKGVQRLLKEQGAKGLATATRAGGGGGVDVEFASPLETADPSVESVAADAMATDPDHLGVGVVTTLTAADRFELETALGTIEECQRILGALDAAERRKL